MLSLLDRKKVRYGVIVDIGSASVSVAIIASTKSKNSLQTIWSHKETSNNLVDFNYKNRLIKHIDSAFFKLGTAGIRALASSTKGKGNVDNLLVTLSTPYAQTVAKKVLYQKDQPFHVNEKLLNELEKHSGKTSLKIIKDSNIMDEIHFVPMANYTTSIKLNGYSVSDPYEKDATKLEFMQITSMVSEEILKTIKLNKNKYLPKVRLHTQPFICTFYEAAMAETNVIDDLILINVNAYTTEIALVTDGYLEEIYSIPQGEHTLAESVSKIYGTIFSESIGYMKDNYISVKQGPEKAEKLNKIFKHYSTKIADLIDNLSAGHAIPQICYISTSNKTEQFFKTLLQNTLNTNEKTIKIQPISTTLQNKGKTSELSSHVFHKDLYPKKSFTH